MASIPDSAGDRTPGRRSRMPRGSRWRAHFRLPATGGPVAFLIVLVAAMTSPSCRSGSDGDPGDAPAAIAADLTPEQRLRADRLINNFEHGTIEFLYGSAEALPDGRGITFGRAGFTTKSGDGYDVIKRYSARKPETPLARYLPRLEVLAREESGSTDGLDGFIEAVRREAGDPLFRQAQDDLQDELYYRPSAKYSDSLGLRTALARTVIYDTLLMHGAGDDPDGLPALLERTRVELGGTPATGKDEAAWFSAFLRVRRADLVSAHNAETREVWAKSVGRVDVFRTLSDQGNWELHGPIVLRGEYAATIP